MNELMIFEKQHTPEEKPSIKKEMEIIQDDSFDYDGYEVVRGEFFSHLHEPCITFNNFKVYMNTACIKKLPETDYVQILVNQEKKKLAVRPCSEESKDSFRWCSATAKRTPKQVTCRVFYGKITELMGWNPNYRYKLVGKLIQSNGQLLFIFDLTAPEIFTRASKDGDNSKISRKPIYPAEWEHQFGIPVEEHQKSLQIDIFDGYALFGMNDKSAKSKMEREDMQHE